MVAMGPISKRDLNAPEEYDIHAEHAVLDSQPRLPTMPLPALNRIHHRDPTPHLRKYQRPHHGVSALSPFDTSFGQASTSPGILQHDKGKAKSVDSYNAASNVEKGISGQQTNLHDRDMTSTINHDDLEKVSVGSASSHKLPHRQSIYRMGDDSMEELTGPEDHLLWIVVCSASSCPIGRPNSK